MAYSASRLTLYALFSGIEEDLRHQVLSNLNGQDDPSNLLGQDLWAKCRERLVKDTGLEDDQPNLDQLLVYADFADTFELLNANSSKLPANVRDAIAIATSKLQSLIPIRNRVMHFRPLNAKDLASTLDIAEELIESSNVIWNDLNSTIIRLRNEPSFVLSLSIPSYEVNSEERRFNLPTSDSDETGFVGRKQQVKDLVSYCLGTYPVITIVGEGGLGKTALAIKVADEIAHLPNCPFDAVVWTSSKTSQLTPQEIVKIEGAITDSLGIFKDIAQSISGENYFGTPIDEVLMYMKEFRILLIMDNLETVMDDRIDGFLRKLPIGSKILITSRIGLGTYEIKFPLLPMEKGEAVTLLRSLARIRQVPNLVKTDNSHLARYCERMHYNPGYIKWFVSAVQSGKSPDEVLANPDIFLDFCMSNVYGYVSNDSQIIVKTLVCLPGKQSLAELQYLTELDVLKLRRAIHELLRTNMVVMSNTPRGNSFDTFYELSELARSYLVKHHPIENRDLLNFRRRKRQLTATKENINVENRSSPYSWLSITMDSQSDLVIARYLRDAVQAAKNRDFEKAENLIRLSENLAPGYFEVHRVTAVVKALQGAIAEANEAYEAAVELKPDSAPLRLWYAGFLARHIEDNEAALEQLQEADRFAPNTFEIQQEMARTHLYLGNFEEARHLIDVLLKSEDVPVWVHRKIYDLHLQFFRRKAEYLLNQRDPHGALEQLLLMKSAYQTCPRNLIDEAMRLRLRRAIQSAYHCNSTIQQGIQRQQALDLANWLMQVTSIEGARSQSPEIGEWAQGKLISIHDSFGFIENDYKQKIFFHLSELMNYDWNALKIGMRVRFTTGMGTDQRICAKLVQVL